jgi:hypothetical protein
MDTVAVILAAARKAKRITLVHVFSYGQCQFDVDPKTFVESFARAGLRPGDPSGFSVNEALDESCILETRQF